MRYYQPKHCRFFWQIIQNYHALALCDSPRIGHLINTVFCGCFFLPFFPLLLVVVHGHLWHLHRCFQIRPEDRQSYFLAQHQGRKRMMWCAPYILIQWILMYSIYWHALAYINILAISSSSSSSSSSPSSISPSSSSSSSSSSGSGSGSGSGSSSSRSSSSSSSTWLLLHLQSSCTRNDLSIYNKYMILPNWLGNV